MSSHVPQFRLSQDRSGQEWSGQVRSGQVWSGKVKYGQASSGQVKSQQIFVGPMGHSALLREAIKKTTKFWRLSKKGGRVSTAAKLFIDEK